MNFKGVILAGGQGSRLSPLTDVYNKYLCPVYDKLMIEYSVYSLKQADITEIAIILGTKSAGETMDYLKSGEKYGVKFTYFYQDKPLGVPNALYQAKDWAGDSTVVVLCADNIIYDNIDNFIEDYYCKGHKGAYITVKAFKDKEQLKRFAVLDLLNNRIIEKPVNPPGNLAFCGVQIYDKNVWGIIEGLVLSSRGEFEIVDVLNKYISKKQFNYGLLQKAWFDCGNKNSLFEAQQFAYINSLDMEDLNFGWGGR